MSQRSFGGNPALVLGVRPTLEVAPLDSVIDRGYHDCGLGSGSCGRPNRLGPLWSPTLLEQDPPEPDPRPNTRGWEHLGNLVAPSEQLGAAFG